MKCCSQYISSSQLHVALHSTIDRRENRLTRLRNYDDLDISTALCAQVNPKKLVILLRYLRGFSAPELSSERISTGQSVMSDFLPFSFLAFCKRRIDIPCHCGAIRRFYVDTSSTPRVL